MRIILAAALLAICSADVVLRIKVKNDADLEKISELSTKYNGTEWGRGKDYFDLQVSEKDAKAIQGEMESTVIIENANKKIAESMKKNEQIKRHLKRRRSGASPVNYFARYNEIVTWMQNLAAQNNFVTIQGIGKTLQNREQKLVKIGMPGSNKKSVFITGGFHAREWLGISSTVYTIHRLIADAKRGDPRIVALLKKFDFYIIPVSNPDGYEYTHKGGRARMWRKTMKHISGRCYGVDPNRNFDIDFGRIGVSRNPCDDSYNGPSPFSEIEVRNIKNFAEGLRGKLVLYFDVHAYSQMVLLPLAYDHNKAFPSENEIKRVGALMQRAIKGTNGRDYVMGAPGDLMYDASGSSLDWFLEKLDVKYVYGFEVYPGQRQFRNGFVDVTPRDIAPTGKEVSEAIIVAAENIRV